MSELARQLLIMCPGLFLAGFADSVAGGGGLIHIPAAILAGLPIHTAYGTNKLSMSIGTAASTIRYARTGNIRWRSAIFAALGAIPGATLGAKLALLLDEKFLSYCLIVLLPCAAVFMLVNKNFGEGKEKELPQLAQAVWSFFIGLFIGAYDGFFGPGAGTLFILLFCSILGYSFLTANGNAKFANLASNIGALVTYMLNGKVLYAVALPCAVCAILGGLLGSSLAIKNGAKFVRPIMFLMMGLLIVKIAMDYIF